MSEENILTAVLGKKRSLVLELYSDRQLTEGKTRTITPAPIEMRNTSECDENDQSGYAQKICKNLG